MFISRILERFLVPVVVVALTVSGINNYFKSECIVDIYSNCLKHTDTQNCSDLAIEMCN